MTANPNLPDPLFSFVRIAWKTCFILLSYESRIVVSLLNCCFVSSVISNGSDLSFNMFSLICSANLKFSLKFFLIDLQYTTISDYKFNYNCKFFWDMLENTRK